MNKIGILTFYNACNYGAFLQAKALKEYLEEKTGSRIYLIEYKNKKIDEDYSLRGIFKQKQKVKTTFLKLLRIKDIIKRNYVFRRCQRENFAFVRIEEVDKFDKVIVGSDQVWNLELTDGDLNYFLPFIEPECRVSYAASMGQVTDKMDKESFVELVSEFYALSFREKELADLINTSKLEKKATVCIDPVFLKSKEAWKEYSKKDLSIKGKYILVFIMGVSKQADYIVKCATKIGKTHGYKVILLGDQERWYKYRNLKHYGVATPREFVGLIDHAECVLTNSFHATAFSIILNVPFYIEMNIRNNSRLKSLLKLVDLESREMFNGELDGKLDMDINWKKVNFKMKQEIDKSREFIQENILN